MHATTKATTVGIGVISVAGALGVDGAAAKILLSAIAIFVTAPSGAHVVGRAASGSDDLTEDLEVHPEALDDHSDLSDRSGGEG